MRALLAALVLALAAPAAARAQEEPPAATTSPAATSEEVDPPGFRAGLDLFAGWVMDGSATRVREGDLQGTPLRLSQDLGIDVAGEARLTLGGRFDRDDALAFSASSLFLYGGARIQSQVDYNGSSYVAGSRMDTRPQWLAFELRYERVLVRWAEGGRGRLALDLGLRVDWMHWYFDGTPTPAAAESAEMGEGFDRQATPIPVIGLSLRQPLTEGLDLTASARGFRANHWGSLRSEGGHIYFSESFVEATLGVAWTPLPWLEVRAGARYMLVDIEEESHEDGNLVTLSTIGGEVGVVFSF